MFLQDVLYAWFRLDQKFDDNPTKLIVPTDHGLQEYFLPNNVRVFESKFFDSNGEMLRVFSYNPTVLEKILWPKKCTLSKALDFAYKSITEKIFGNFFSFTQTGRLKTFLSFGHKSC